MVLHGISGHDKITMVFLLFLFLGASFQLRGFFHVGPIFFWVAISIFSNMFQSKKSPRIIFIYSCSVLFCFGGGKGCQGVSNETNLEAPILFFGRRTKKFLEVRVSFESLHRLLGGNFS